MTRKKKKHIDPDNMDLRGWLYLTETPVEDLRCYLRVSSGYMYEILRGRKVPSKKIMEKINLLTMGTVGKCNLKRKPHEAKGLDEKGQDAIV